jgi:tetratricopeptide (TPR) repeat protein
MTNALLLLTIFLWGEPPAPPDPPRVAPTNLVPNPGFEEGTGKGPAHWDRPDELTTFWEADPERGGKCIHVNSRVANDEYHARLEELEQAAKKNEEPPPAKKPRPLHPPYYDAVGGNDGVGYWCPEFIDVKPGAIYELSCDVRSGGGAPKIWVKAYVEMPFEIQGEDGKPKKVLLRRVAYKVALDAEGGPHWKRSTLTFCPTKDRDDIKWMRVELYAYWPAEDYWFDNVSLVETGVDKEAPARWAARREKAEAEAKAAVDGKVRDARLTLAYIRKGIDRYVRDLGAPPPSLRALVENPKPDDDRWSGPYVLELGTDPWGTPWHYKALGEKYELKSFGPDSEEGGGDDIEHEEVEDAPRPSAWWNESWPLRRSIVVGDATWGAGPFATAVVDFPTLGRTDPQGRDLRLFRPDGTPASLRVLSSGFEDRCSIAFESSEKGTWTLYFGNEHAEPDTAATCTESAGLVLEVRERDPRPVSSWADMQAILDAPTKTVGRAPWPATSLGWNPWSPEKGGVYVFDGWLSVPKDGTYAFATNSLDASFAAIDSRIVCEWLGYHGATNDAAHQGTIELTAGPHRLQYVNAFRDRGICVLAWEPPGAKGFTPVSGDAFVGWRRARCGPAESREGPVPDFDWQIQDDLALEGRPVTRVRFDALTPIGAVCSWDWGDGTNEQGSILDHVYLEEGTFPVTLTVGGRAVTQKVRVRPRVGASGATYEQRLATYAPIVARYPVAALTPAACFEAGQICHEAGDDEAAARCLRSALERGAIPLKGDDAVWSDRLFELYRTLGNYDDALRVCDLRREAVEALPAAPAPAKGPRPDERWRDALVVRSLVAKAETLYDCLDRKEDALAVTDLVLDRYRKAATDHVRWALIRSGELALALGRTEKAREILEDAETGAEWKKPKGDVEVNAGAHSINFEELLRQDDPDAALDEVLAWEWERPTVILSGLTRHLRGRVHLARREWALAVLEFDRALARDPKGSVADEALYLRGLALESMKKQDAARVSFERLVREFPESQLVPQAKEKLK